MNIINEYLYHLPKMPYLGAFCNKHHKFIKYKSASVPYNVIGGRALTHFKHTVIDTQELSFVKC